MHSSLDFITAKTSREYTGIITDTGDASMMLLQASGTATLNDMYVLGTCTLFQNRVQTGLLSACISISNEGWNVPSHAARVNLVIAIVSPGNLSNYVAAFTQLSATQSSVINAATNAASNYVALTTANVNTQQASVTDTVVNNTISSVFNTFIYQ